MINMINMILMYLADLWQNTSALSMFFPSISTKRIALERQAEDTAGAPDRVACFGHAAEKVRVGGTWRRNVCIVGLAVDQSIGTNGVWWVYDGWMVQVGLQPRGFGQGLVM